MRETGREGRRTTFTPVIRTSITKDVEAVGLKNEAQEVTKERHYLGDYRLSKV